MKPLNDGHASARGSFDNIYMNGQEVFKFAVRAVPTVSVSPCAAAAARASCIAIFWGRVLWRARSCIKGALKKPAAVRLSGWRLRTMTQRPHRYPEEVQWNLLQVVEAALRDADLDVASVDFLVLHQVLLLHPALPAACSPYHGADARSTHPAP